MNKTVLITGATAGIGLSIAQSFAKQGDRLILTGRRTERLQELANSLPTAVFPLTFDIRKLEEVKQAIQSLPDSWKEVDILINNAGLASGKEAIQNGLIEDWDKMIDTNVKGLLYLSKEIIPGMVQKGRGHIINIGSIAGKQVYPGGGVYCATKFAVDALSQAMRIDLLPHGIKVTNVAPGAVETEFSMVRFKGDKAKADSVYQGYTPLRAEDIADIVMYVANQPIHVNINEIVVTATAQANSHYLYKKS
ncbi:MAG: SDR family NAD(P)-dependent oxidoreductase [Bacteroidota bacterium]